MNRLTTKDNYNNDLETAKRLARETEKYLGWVDGESSEQAEKWLSDILNNSWVEYITISEWLDRAGI